MLLAPENLVTKKINGQVVKARELVEYFKSYIKIYKGDELPEPKSMLVVSFIIFGMLNSTFLFSVFNVCPFFKATAEANNLSAVADAKELYMQMMDCVCGGTKPFLATAHLESENQRCVDKALHQFQNKRKMGGEEFSQMYMEKLIKVCIFLSS